MSSPTQKRVVLPRTKRAVPTHATHIGRTGSQQVISVSVIVKRKNPLEVHKLGGRILSREEFDAQYAGDPASFDALRQFAHQHGLAVDEAASSLSRRTLVLRGPAQAMERAFGVELNDYEETGTSRRFHGFAGEVSLPESHSGLVDAVLGLDARPVAKPHVRFLKNAAKGIVVAPNQAAANPFNPPQVAAL